MLAFAKFLPRSSTFAGARPLSTLTPNSTPKTTPDASNHEEQFDYGGNQSRSGRQISTHAREKLSSTKKSWMQHLLLKITLRRLFR